MSSRILGLPSRATAQRPVDVGPEAAPKRCEMTEPRKEEWWVMTYLPRISLLSTYLPITEPDLCFLLALETAVFALAALSFCRNIKCPEIHACGFILMLEQK